MRRGEATWCGNSGELPQTKQGTGMKTRDNHSLVIVTQSSEATWGRRRDGENKIDGGGALGLRRWRWRAQGLGFLGKGLAHGGGTLHINKGGLLGVWAKRAVVDARVAGTEVR
jgi:hypothetical protein